MTIEPHDRHCRTRHWGFAHLSSAHLTKPGLFAFHKVFLDTKLIFRCLTIEFLQFLRVLICEFLLWICEEGTDVLELVVRSFTYDGWQA